ncbi:tripartite ATP-independent transporter solute receptor, DctP family [Lentibacillus persicus]|uniref:Tripartite ATP-independent transporter solute receptor, DctP family n=1 Tax=Lentibacillus persicus TaxID=640948 RepID=A0A1I1YPV4_9BACI|nr:TRAP transporter substrate-binding protein [Lentibacillus persicus]SFE21342.1 tripartite ATP-independent transporter solute receptor, DctP family [Lentibacillus persicus]
MKKFLPLMFIVFIAVIIGGCSQSGSGEESGEPEEVVLRLAENQPENNPVTIAMKEFSDIAEQKSDGEVKIEVYPNAQLGEETENIDQVQSGELDMARVNSVPVSQVVGELSVFTLPYIFTDQEHKYRVLDGEIGKEVSEKFKDHDLINFGYLEAGSRNFYTTEKPIKSVEDMEGMKIRVQPSDISVQMVELLGAVPTPMDYGEVFSSLQTGVIDGAENDFVSYHTSGHYEVAPYYTLDGHLSPPALIIMNKDTWEGLSEKHQNVISEAADEAIEFEREEMNKSQEEFRKEVEEAGTEIFEVDVEEFQEAVSPIYEEMSEYEELIERVREE